MHVNSLCHPFIVTFKTSIILDHHFEQLFAESPDLSLRYLSVFCLFSREHLSIWRHIGQYKQTLPFGDRPRDTVFIQKYDLDIGNVLFVQILVIPVPHQT